MIGTFHRDVEGETRIKTQLRSFQPNAVLLEGSQGLFDAQKVAMEELARLIDEQGVDGKVAELLLFEQGRKQHEARAAMEYCAETGINYSFFDDNLEHRSAAKVRQFTQESLTGILSSKRTKEDLLRFMRETLAAEVVANQARATFFKLFGNTDHEFLLPQAMPNFVKNTATRDPIMFAALQKQLAAGSDRVVTITGATHVLVDQGRSTLYCRAFDAGLSVTRAIPSFEE
jgi:hypothetical protein